MTFQSNVCKWQDSILKWFDSDVLWFDWILSISLFMYHWQLNCRSPCTPHTFTSVCLISLVTPCHYSHHLYTYMCVCVCSPVSAYRCFCSITNFCSTYTYSSKTYVTATPIGLQCVHVWPQPCQLHQPALDPSNTRNSLTQSYSIHGQNITSQHESNSSAVCTN